MQPLKLARWNKPAFRLLSGQSPECRKTQGDSHRGEGDLAQPVQERPAGWPSLRKLSRDDATMSKTFAQFANYIAEVSGQPGVFGAAAMTVVLWLVTGPIFAYSDTWQLVMNSWTNVVTFLMVFVIQNSQNRDSSALQAKIDELIRASAARNSFVGIEQLTPEEIDEIRKRAQPPAPKMPRTENP
jgi:low affinity Fe/Cu permease